MENTDNVHSDSFQEAQGSTLAPHRAEASSFKQPESETLLKSIKWIVYASVFLIPLFFLPFTSDALNFPKQIILFTVAAAAVILWMVNVLQAGTLRFKFTLLDWVVLGLVGSAVLSSVFSVNLYRSVFGSIGGGNVSLVVILSLAALYFVTINTFNVGDMRWLLRGFNLSILLALVFTAFQVFGVQILPFAVTKSRAFNTVGSLNAVAVLAIIGFLLALGSFRVNKLFSLKSVVPALTVVFAFLILIVVNWWVLWLITIVGLIANFGVLAAKKSFRIKDSVIAGVTISLILLIMISNFRLEVRNQLPVEVSVSYKTSAKISLNSLLSRPVWGFGLENFSLAYDKFRPASVNATPFWTFRFSDSTSELMNKLTEEGVIGLAAALLLFAGVIGAFFYSVKVNKEDIFSVFPAIAASIFAFVLYPFNLTLYFALFMLLSGFVVFGAHNPEPGGDSGSGRLASKILTNKKFEIGVEESSKNSMVTSVVFTLMIILIIVGGYFVSQQLRANILFAKAVRLGQNSDIEKVTDYYNRAIAINPKEDSYYRSYADFLIRRAAAESRNTQEDPQEVASRVQLLSANAVNVSKALTDTHPKDSLNWLTRGFVYQNLLNLIRGSDIWAIRSYDEFQKLSPTNPLGYSRLGNVYLTQANTIRNNLNNQNLAPEVRQDLLNQYNENLANAEKNFKRAVELKRDFASALYNLGVVYDRQGRVGEAIQQLQATSQAAPGEAGLAFELGLLYLRNNQKEEAFNELQRAVALFGDYSNARWFLGLLYEERGQLDQAIVQIQRVLELNPDNLTVRDKLEKLLAGQREIPPAQVIEQQPIEPDLEQQEL